MIKIIVYADILIVLNLIVNYFLLLAAAKLLKIQIKTLRIVLSSLIGAVSSLYIFLPPAPVWVELIFKISLCLIMSAVCFGVKNSKFFIKAVFLLFSVTCAYAGIMMAVWHIFKPSGMVINNSVVYFDISPLVLVGSSAAVYFLFVILNFALQKNCVTAEECEISLNAKGNSVEFKAILDSGNSLVDIFGKSEIIIADRTVSEELFKNISEEELSPRFRMIPCNTVSGSDLLKGYRLDKALVYSKEKSITLEKPILAISKTPLNDGYKGIVNPKILE